MLWGCEKKDEAKPTQQPTGQHGQLPPNVKIDELPEAQEPELRPVTRFQAGRLFEAKKDYFSAAMEYEKAISLNRDMMVAYIRLATCYVRLDKLPIAEQVLRVASQRQPQMASLHNNLGFVLLLQRRYPEAEAEFREALAIQPKFVRAQVNLGLTLGYLGRFDQAFEAFKVVLSEADAHFNLGQVHELLGQRSQAMESYKAALAINPDMADAKSALERLTNQMESASDSSQGPSQGVTFAQPSARPEPSATGPSTSQPLVIAEFVGPPMPSREMPVNPTTQPGPALYYGPQQISVATPPATQPAITVVAENPTPSPTVLPASTPLLVLVPASRPVEPVVLVPATQPMAAASTTQPVALAPASQPQPVVVPTQPPVIAAWPTPTPLGMGYPLVEVTAVVLPVQETDYFPAQP